MRFFIQLGVVILMLPFFALAQNEVDFEVYTVLQPNEGSENIWIEAEKYSFAAIYDTSEQSFEQILIPFSVLSPESFAVNSYDLTLTGSHHQCGEEEFDVIVELDKEELQLYESISDINFDYIENGNQKKNHTFTIDFPVIEQKQIAQKCLGSIQVIVSANV